MNPFITWLFSKGPRERSVLDATDKLQMSMRTTAKCRYNASVRLHHQNKYAFFTIIALSLGLVFIPLIQTAGVPLALMPAVLSCMQIFLAVAVLVYSIVISTARYDLRAAQLTECGDKLKDLIREIDRERETGGGKVAAERLAPFQRTYSEVVTDVENHERNDYRFASLEMVNDYFLTGFPRLKLWGEARLVRLTSFLVPSGLMLLEAILILDMIGATSILAPYLNGTHAGA